MQGSDVKGVKPGDSTGQLCRNPRACSPRADHAYYRSGCRGKYTRGTLDCPGLLAWNGLFSEKKKKKSSEHLDLFQSPVSLGQDFQLLRLISRSSTVIPRFNHLHSLDLSQLTFSHVKAGALGRSRQRRKGPHASCPKLPFILSRPSRGNHITPPYLQLDLWKDSIKPAGRSRISQRPNIANPHTETQQISAVLRPVCYLINTAT